MKPRTLAPVLIIGLLLLTLLSPFIGSIPIRPADILSSDPTTPAHTIFWQIRLPRLFLGICTGIILAVSGMIFQAMFRNPLATPYTLGVSSGASFGAVLFMRAGFELSSGVFSGVTLAAFLGALTSIGLVYSVVRLRGVFSTSRLLLAGVAASFLFSSLIMFIHYTANVQDTFRLMRWLMGSLAMPGYTLVWQLMVVALVAVTVAMLSMRELDLLSTGDDIAASRGVNVERIRHILFFATSLMVGAVVAACGPIGFVGLMVPHICRLLVGPGHVRLAPSVILTGAVFLPVCDLLARTLAAPAEIPVGVITALLGGPFFLWLLMRDRE